MIRLLAGAVGGGVEDLPMASILHGRLHVPNVASTSGRGVTTKEAKTASSG